MLRTFHVAPGLDVTETDEVETALVTVNDGFNVATIKVTKEQLEAFSTLSWRMTFKKREETENGTSS